MANLIRPAISGMTTDEVRRAIGDSEGNAGTTRRDCGKFKSPRPERIHGLSLDRLYVFIEDLKIEPYETPAPASVLVH